MNAELIRVLRFKEKLTQREFAEKVRCHHSLINMIERGRRPITKTTERKIREAFNLDDQKILELASLLKRIRE